MAADNLPVRADLAGLVPYGAPQLEVAVRLNVNENPFPPSSELAADIGRAAAQAALSLNRYPDRDARQLRADLADYLTRETDVPFMADQMWAANGSNEIMLQLLQTFGGPDRVALGFAPTYSMYADYCRDSFTRYITTPRAPDFSVDIDAAVDAVREYRPDVVLLASPNNPTGTALPLATAVAILDTAPGMVVIDEAYAEFRRAGTPSAVELLAAYPRLIVTRTMSKAFGLAGARVGYLAASEAVVDAVQLVRLPYHLSAITQAVARAALAHADHLQEQILLVRAERDALVDWLRVREFVVADSDANFVLFGEFEDRHAIWQGLLERGVLIRETGPTGWLRVSIGTPEENAAFRAALVEVTA